MIFWIFYASLKAAENCQGALGALTGGQAVQMVKAGLQAILGHELRMPARSVDVEHIEPGLVCEERVIARPATHDGERVLEGVAPGNSLDGADRLARVRIEHGGLLGDFEIVETGAVEEVIEFQIPFMGFFYKFFYHTIVCFLQCSI